MIPRVGNFPLLILMTGPLVSIASSDSRHHHDVLLSNIDQALKVYIVNRSHCNPNPKDTRTNERLQKGV